MDNSYIKYKVLGKTTEDCTKSFCSAIEYFHYCSDKFTTRNNLREEGFFHSHTWKDKICHNGESTSSESFGYPSYGSLCWLLFIGPAMRRKDLRQRWNQHMMLNTCPSQGSGAIERHYDHHFYLKHHIPFLASHRLIAISQYKMYSSNYKVPIFS